MNDSTKLSIDAQRADVVVIGAGLGGLATAARVAASGRRVIACERASSPGGRGRTRTREGFALNLGAHALYRTGPAMTMLRELGIEPVGRQPSGRGVLVRGGREHALPATPLTTVTTTAFDLRDKFALMRLFAGLRRIDAEALRTVDCRTWLERAFPSEALRRFVATVLRLSTYCSALELLSAEAAIRQLRAAVRGVLYLDGGWAQLVDALVERATASGVELRLGTGARSIARADTARWAVEVDGAVIGCEHVVIAGSPQLADTLLGSRARCTDELCPVRAATLDLGLRGDWPGPSFALDLDEPIYLSVHSQIAALAPPGHTLVSLIWYRAPDEPRSGPELRARLERFARRFMPTLERALVVDQFLPEITVAHDLAQAARGGLRGRAPTQLDDGLHLVGDWVGDRGMLLDASLASAASVAATILEDEPSARALDQLSARPRPG